MVQIYDQFDKAFRGVSAYVVAKDGKQIGKIALQYARSGLRTTAWVHILGTRMVKAYASGGGYDKASAAVCAAMSRLTNHEGALDQATFDAFSKAVKDHGQHWDYDLRAAGFNVWQAV